MHGEGLGLQHGRNNETPGVALLSNGDMLSEKAQKVNNGVEGVTQAPAWGRHRAIPSPPCPPIAAAPMVRRFRVTRQLGQGGTGLVQGARDERLGRSVAIKLITLGPRHPRAAAAANHPHIRRIYELPALAAVHAQGIVHRDLKPADLHLRLSPPFRALFISLVFYPAWTDHQREPRDLDDLDPGSGAEAQIVLAPGRPDLRPAADLHSTGG
jgi:hypothetical protein